jgi:GTP-binding protein
MIRERLLKEAEGNVSIKIRETEQKDAFEIAGRGELQLGVLLENLRREGFELSVSRPRVLFERGPDGERLEPIEEVSIDVDDPFTGVVIEKMAFRKGDLQDMRPSGGGKTRILFLVPARGLIGYHGEFLTDTRGTGIMHSVFHSYGPYRGDIGGRRQGVLVSMADGEAVSYALWNMEERGILFIGGGEKVYTGMIIGEHNRDNDLDVNPLKSKQLTNFRTTSKDDAVRLTPPRVLTLEEAIAYIDDTELVEITPRSIRLRKRYLDPSTRKKMEKKMDD